VVTDDREVSRENTYQAFDRRSAARFRAVRLEPRDVGTVNAIHPDDFLAV